MHTVVIGNGISGISTALSLRRNDSNVKITVVSGESELHYSRPALMYLYMGHMKYENTIPYPKSFFRKHKIDLKFGWVKGVNSKKKSIIFKSGEKLTYERLVLAVGAKSNKFGWPGQDLPGVQGLYSLQDVELLEENSKNAQSAIIVGGGLIGIELAEMLHSRGIHVSFLIRETGYWNSILPDEESAMVGRAIEKEGIKIIRKTNLSEIIEDGNGRCCKVKTEFGDELPCEIVGLTPGVSPNKSLAEKLNIATGRGIIVNSKFQTSVDDIYAVGDCAEIPTEDGKSKVEQLWYTGRAQGETLGRQLSGENCTYEPGLFYNSAKFLDIEYQVYGEVYKNREGDNHLYAEAEDGRRSIRLITNNDGYFIGVQTMGIRFRQSICHQWIEEKAEISRVLENLSDAGFDPEFTKRFEPIAARKLKAEVLKKRVA